MNSIKLYTVITVLSLASSLALAKDREHDPKEDVTHGEGVVELTEAQRLSAGIATIVLKRQPVAAVISAPRGGKIEHLSNG